MRVRLTLLSAVAFVGILAGQAAASGPPGAVHSGATTAHQLPAGSVAATVLLAALLLGGALVRRRSRRALAVVLVLSLALLSFESGVHSVHHLGQKHQPAECAIAGTSTHLCGATPVTVDVGPSVLASAERLQPIDAAPLRPALRLPDQGRAPPSLA